MNVREQLDKRAKLITDARALIEFAEKENRDLNAEETVRYDQMLADANSIKDKIEREKRLSAMESDIEQGPIAPENREPINRADAEEDIEKRSKLFTIFSSREYQSAVQNYLANRGLDRMDPQQRAVIHKAETQARALQADLDSAGGVFFGIQNANQIVKSLDNLVFVRQYATTFQVEGASDGLGAPAIETDMSDLEWTSEIGQVDEDSDLDFGKRELHPYMLAKLVKVSLKMMRKMPSIERLVNERLAYKYAVPQENAFLNGNGVNQPLGVFTASANGVPTTRDVVSGHATQITADGLRNVKYSLKAPYRVRARWLFHRDGLSHISKLKDGEGRYIWQPGLAVADPDRILGLPVDESEYAPSTFTENSYIGMLCDWSHYWIADDMLWSIQVLNELYARNNQVGFIGRGSSDGMPVLPEAFARVKLSAG